MSIGFSRKKKITWSVIIYSSVEKTFILNVSKLHTFTMQKKNYKTLSFEAHHFADGHAFDFMLFLSVCFCLSKAQYWLFSNLEINYGHIDVQIWKFGILCRALQIRSAIFSPRSFFGNLPCQLKKISPIQNNLKIFILSNWRWWRNTKEVTNRLKKMMMKEMAKKIRDKKIIAM